ncbi:MAG TPA: tRNA (adenosine(37)-N6)-threonylcarbamoyltransferase complex transferase subunit TsaD [Candidatus Aphodovivens avistercoris]|nr:tRNA (adenosine(37)-N6)-threonylcarbamoyltransferase complex transferase subunit TsaD [Candidatus Aphodovivens avistercoris]
MAARGAAASNAAARCVLAFDTSNEVIAIGVGALDPSTKTVEPIACAEARAHRASNTQLLPRIDALLSEHSLARENIACVACGRGPGSFTGVRIAMATAKGVAAALGVGLVGFSTLDAVAWGAQAAGVRGRLLVAADAMRKEVYPVRYRLDDEGAHRLEADRVVKAADVPDALGVLAGEDAEAEGDARFVAGDALVKYAGILSPLGEVLPEALWEPTGSGLLRAVQALWRADEADPFDALRHDPALALPVYTRLSDAEENERIRLAKNDPKNLRTGVQDVAPRRDQRATMHDTAILNARPDAHGITYKPLDAAHAAAVAALEARVMGSDAWSEALVADELPRGDRTWWAAYGVPPSCRTAERADAAASRGTGSSPADEGLRTEVRGASASERIFGTTETLADVANEMEGEGAAQQEGVSSDQLQLVGYAGGWIVDGDVQVLKVGVDPAWRRRGIARELLARVASDARDLGASTCSLEVRAANEGAQAFYRALGFEALGTRPRYYSDGEDALIMQGSLPLAHHDVAGMELQVFDPAAEVASDHASSPAESAAVAPAPAAASSATASGPESAAAASALDARRPLILAIESSCDETAAAIVDGAGNLVSDVVASQIDFHARFGGVVPEIASRKHIEAVCGVCDECFDVAASALGVVRLSWADLDGVAVTYAPGLLGALVVGVAFAKGAAWAADKPLVRVNHLEGHLYANKIAAPGLQPPLVASLVSGGNTMLVHVKDWGSYETLGSTIDDAVGEAFDKVAKALGLGYPGGPAISRAAAQGDPAAIAFPRAMMHSGDLRFSLSGLKTAVVTYINDERAAGRPLNIPDIAASFQQAVVDVQVSKAKKALQLTGARTFCLGGGVAANPVLRASYEQLCAKLGVRLVMPPLSACGDNAGMIALVALDRFRQGKFMGLADDAQAHANLDEPY